ncbi:cation:proton antiporter subunit C [Candidatus Oleimmundimicrobium sp.]|uniref:cation:proton antiporter subunit C n=1 Tax=Candidatus Oleimmundimicrobium sp. TaxID=3060597 RepID=UPI00272173DD|nr:cation:proton antiporter subunit C [Candidatus Oleimmundimicrobium sp.]MDO8886896.1 cation:proton antiporter subunit C [Candidatus Oleimmundimicrobium sp.]
MMFKANFLNLIYTASIILFFIGFYAVAVRSNLIKKIIGINIMETAVFLFLVGIGSKEGGAVPIVAEGVKSYINPFPQAIVLMALVVGIGTTSLALILAVRLFESESEGKR